ncbi:MAG: hypothetical protein LUG46_07645 [Erysipelotrichaceae bacterium]|nr:hypothetical protein [Erysipelotrichaceae bacterium]
MNNYKVVLAYTISPYVGVTAIWWAIPIGWIFADTTGFIYFILKKKIIFESISNKYCPGNTCLPIKLVKIY